MPFKWSHEADVKLLLAILSDPGYKMNFEHVVPAFNASADANVTSKSIRHRIAKIRKDASGAPSKKRDIGEADVSDEDEDVKAPVKRSKKAAKGIKQESGNQKTSSSLLLVKDEE